MSKKANPTTLGIFIFAGLLLGVVAVMLFASTKFFTKSATFIVYFDTSLNGLREGAPVKFRGVTIGSVSRVMIKFNQGPTDTAMPVIFELQEDLIRPRLEGSTTFTSLDNITEIIRKGLRAKLETESLVTGVLYVSLEIEDDAPPPVFHQARAVYPEIPSRPTTIQQMMKNLASLDLPGLEQKITSLITKVDSVFGTLKLEEITGNLTNVLVSLNRVLGTPDLTNSLSTLKVTLDKYRLLAEKLGPRVDSLSESLTNTLVQFDRTLAQTQGGMQNFRDLLAPDSPFRHNVTIALEQLADASQSIAILAEFLNVHPNALLAGRKAPAQKR